jgi:hypothetical protein
MKRLLVLFVLAGTAAAQPKPDDVKRAAELYDRGKRHFDIAEYGAAIAAWKEAYLLSSEPLLLFNIAQAHRLAGDCAQANRFYMNYKRVQPKPPNQAELDSAMQKCAGVPPATGDTTPVPPVTPIEPVPPPAEPPPPVVQQPPPQPTTRVDTYEDRGRTYRITGIALAGAGVASGLIAAVFAVRANSKSSDIEGQRPGTQWNPSLDQTERDGKSAQTNARVFTAIGIGALVGGTALYFYGRSQSSVRVDVQLAPQQSQVSLSCVF